MGDQAGETPNGSGARGMRFRRGMSKVNLVALNRRIDELEAEMQETRRLNRRVAELLDVVEEMLIPISLGEEDKVRDYVERRVSSP